MDDAKPELDVGRDGDAVRARPSYPPLDWRAVAARRASCQLGREIVYRAEVESTMLLASSLLPAAGPGTVVVADYQTAGRGRLGRRWIAPFGSSLTFTVVLAPLMPAWPAPMIAGLALAEALDLCRIPATLKWPNDVLVGDRKCAGILIEGTPVRGDYWLLVGMGLNVRIADPSLPLATYLDAHISSPLSREELLVTILDRLEGWLVRAVADPAAVRAAWKSRLATLGQAVSVQAPAGALHGVAEDVAEDGGLILRLDDGRRQVVQAGDVTLAAVAP